MKYSLFSFIKNFINIFKKQSNYLYFKNKSCMKLTNNPIDINKCYNSVLDPSCGAVSMFSGITRDYYLDKQVLKLSYTAFDDMVYHQFDKLEEQIRTKWTVNTILIIHRLGDVGISECSVLICISSNHRQDSLEAVDYAINKLKENFPIWKKEIYSDSSVWKENKEFINNNKIKIPNQYLI